MKQQNIHLRLCNSDYTLSIAQGVGGGSQRNHHVEVALLDGTGEFINSGYWWVDSATYAQIDQGCYDDVVSHIDAENLLFVIAKAQAWVGRNQ